VNEDPGSRQQQTTVNLELATELRNLLARERHVTLIMMTT